MNVTKGGDIVMERMKDVQQFQTLIDGEQPVIAVFKAVWCADCHYMSRSCPNL